MKKNLVIVAAILMASCSSTRVPANMSEPSLFQKWDLISLRGENVTARDHKSIFIEFSDSTNKASGSGPCNRFFSTFTRNDHNLKLSSIGSTKMACINNEYNRLELSFFECLQKTDSYAFEDGKLLLKADGKTLAEFESHNPTPDTLSGKWELFYISGRKIAFQGLYPDARPTLTFTAGSNDISGFTSCNSMSAKYVAKKGKPLFKPGVMTLMACPGEGEQVFMETFKKIDDFNVKDDTLTLFVKSIPMMKFKKLE